MNGFHSNAFEDRLTVRTGLEFTLGILLLHNKVLSTLNVFDAIYVIKTKLSYQATSCLVIVIHSICFLESEVKVTGF